MTRRLSHDAAISPKSRQSNRHVSVFQSLVSLQVECELIVAAGWHGWRGLDGDGWHGSLVTSKQVELLRMVVDEMCW